MSSVLVGSYPIGVINVGLDGAITAFIPLLSQFDLLLTGSFGLGGLAADLSLQLSAALSFQANIGLQISNPLAALQAELQAIIQLQASIALTLSLGLPSITVSLSVSLSASVALSGLIALQLSGINLLIQASLAIKLPLVSLVADLQATLSLGPVVLVSIGFASPSTLLSSGLEYTALASAPLGGINPTDQVYGVVMLTKDPSVAAGLSAIIKTS